MKSVLICVLLTIFACFSGIQGTTYTIVTSGLTWSPSSITINTGDTITWNFASNTHNVAQSSSAASNVYEGTPGFYSGVIGAGGPNVFSQTFATAGTYYFLCEAHATLGMKGMIIVNVPVSSSMTATFSGTITMTDSLSTSFSSSWSMSLSSSWSTSMSNSMSISQSWSTSGTITGTSSISDTITGTNSLTQTVSTASRTLVSMSGSWSTSMSNSISSSTSWSNTLSISLSWTQTPSVSMSLSNTITSSGSGSWTNTISSTISPTNTNTGSWTNTISSSWSSSLSTSRTHFICGNGIVDPGEQCDPGPTVKKWFKKCCAKNCLFRKKNKSCENRALTVCIEPNKCDGKGNCSAPSVKFHPKNSPCRDRKTGKTGKCNGQGTCVV